MAAIERAKILARKILQNYYPIKEEVPIEKIAEDHGIEIKYISLSEEVDGAMKRSGKEGKPVIIVNSNELSEERKRFTIAHELGHFLLHSPSPQYIDKHKVYFRDSDSSTGENIMEIQANQFAAELLMTTKYVGKSLWKKCL
jgi:Zn-dependent peptidase ImmA (M78 family)